MLQTLQVTECSSRQTGKSMKSGKSSPVSNKWKKHLPIINVFLKIALTWEPNHIHCKTQQCLLSELPKHLEDNLLIKKNMKVFWIQFIDCHAVAGGEREWSGIGCLSRVHTGLSRPQKKAHEWQCSKGQGGCKLSLLCTCCFVAGLSWITSSMVRRRLWNNLECS